MDAFARLAAMSALLGTAAALQAQTKVIYVDASAPAGGDGTSWNRAFRDLTPACDEATHATRIERNCVQIRLAKGVYRPSPSRKMAYAAFEVGDNPDVASGVVLVSAFSLSVIGGFAGRSAPDPN